MIKQNKNGYKVLVLIKLTMVYNFSTCSHISYLGQSKGALGMSSIGIVVFEPGENLKFVKSLIRPIFVCINPNLKPIQLRGPSPVQNENKFQISNSNKKHTKWQMCHGMTIFLILFCKPFRVELLGLWVNIRIVMNANNWNERQRILLDNKICVGNFVVV